jgi:Protein of unknown function (DUF2997)
MEEIKVRINKDGTLSYEVKGVQGSSCKDLTKFIDAMSKGVESKNTAEFYMERGDDNRLTNGRF